MHHAEPCGQRRYLAAPAAREEFLSRSRVEVMLIPLKKSADSKHFRTQEALNSPSNLPVWTAFPPSSVLHSTTRLCSPNDSFQHKLLRRGRVSAKRMSALDQAACGVAVPPVSKQETREAHPPTHELTLKSGGQVTIFSDCLAPQRLSVLYPASHSLQMRARTRAQATDDICSTWRRFKLP